MEKPRDPEIQGYVGILFVQQELLGQLCPDSRGPAARVELVGRETLEVSWRGGGQSRIRWAELRERASLPGLPPPRLAFLGESDELGLLIASETPRAGLRFREPHSVVQAIGLLTPTGLRPLG